MGTLLHYLVIYVLGGITFLPLVFLLVLLHAHLTFPVRDPSSESTESPDPLQDATDDKHSLQSHGGLTNLAPEFQRGHEPDVAAGYFAVCREYVPGGINGKPPERTTPAGAQVATESPSVYQSMYRSIFDRKQGPTLDPGKGNGKTVKRGRNVFFVVLRHGHLMLYEDSEQLEVKHVISLEHHNISIYGEGGLIPEGELWIKRNAIKLTRNAKVDGEIAKPFFFFSDNCSDKEDFYFALLQNQEVKPGDPNSPPRPQHYETKNIIGLVRMLHSSEEQLQTRWINALVGRLFLALYQTKEAEDFIRKKITKKIARVKKPAFLSGIVLQKVDLGESAPNITNPRLKDLTVDGDCCIEADVKYSGNFRLEIAATVRIDLGARFKAREVNIVLAVVVKKLEGHALLKFKPPPSNRLWISFETMPDMEMAIEPIVSSRQITYGIILRAIESRIREVMAETIVLPHWDDSPFTDTTEHKFRGGIWEREQSIATAPLDPIKIPDEAPEDEAEVEVDEALAPPSPQKKNERIMSMPVLPDQTHVDAPDSPSTTSAPKIERPPKVLRSRSFASVANPLLSMDNANVNSKQIEKNKNKKHKDATSTMMAISHRPRTSVSTEGSLSSTPERPTLWESSRNASRSSTISTPSDNTDQALPSTVLPDSPAQTQPPNPNSTTSLSIKSAFGSDTLQPNSPHSDTRSSPSTEKKQAMAAIGAATAAAKKWGWGVLARSSDLKDKPASNPDRVGTPSNPIGRGRPLPPPGQPLPFPDGQRPKNPPNLPQRKKPAAPPALPSRPQDEVKPRATAPPPLPNRRRMSSAPVEIAAADDGVLVVEAPPDSAPSSPGQETHKDSGVDTGVGEEKGIRIPIPRGSATHETLPTAEHPPSDNNEFPRPEESDDLTPSLNSNHDAFPFGEPDPETLTPVSLPASLLQEGEGEGDREGDEDEDDEGLSSWHFDRDQDQDDGETGAVTAAATEKDG